MSDAAVVVENPPPAEAVAAEAEAAVSIAEIQADAAVTMNADSADAAVQIAEAHATEDDDVQWLRAELADLRAQCATNADGLSALRTQNEILASQMAEIVGSLATMVANSQSTPLPPSPEATAEAERATREAEAAEAAGAVAVQEAAAPAAAEAATERGRRWLGRR